MDLSGDWDVVSSVDPQEDEKETKDTGVANDRASNEIENVNPGEGSRIQDLAEPESNAGNESSSSDIDIIDEYQDDIERQPKSCFIPSTLTISTSTEKTSDSYSEPVPSTADTVSTTPSESDRDEKTPSEDARESYTSFWTKRFGGRTIHEWAALLWDYLSSLTGFQIGSLLGLTFCLYFCITINQTNIIALQEKGHVVSQMEKLVEELRNDNKHLKEQMISEMKNDKLVSSFEHQIRELKKENSKLNHMLYDVVKVLEKQKDTQEKFLTRKEDEYKAPFKKEINKLKEHINMLKFDNEELQKQLVRMRYSSYSQGGKHTGPKDKQDQGKFKGEKDSGSMKNEQQSSDNKAEKQDFSSEIPIDIQQLKKWNDLLDLVAKELGIFEKSYSGQDESNPQPEEKLNWKEGLKQNFKKHGAFVSEMASKYAEQYGKIFNDMYDSASNYINGAQENVQSLFESFQTADTKETNSKDNKIWNVINDLGEKWSQMKKHVGSLNIKEQFKWVDKLTKNPDESKNGDEDPVQYTKSGEKQTDKNLKTQFKEENGAAANDAEEKEWFFKRANLREDLRKDEDESAENWFLRRKRDLLSQQAEDENGINGENIRGEF